MRQFSKAIFSVVQRGGEGEKENPEVVFFFIWPEFLQPAEPSEPWGCPLHPQCLDCQELLGQALQRPESSLVQLPSPTPRHPARDPPETWVLRQPDSWVSCLNAQPSRVLAESLPSHLQPWDSGPSRAGRQRASPLGPVSQGKSFATSICISLKLLRSKS